MEIFALSYYILCNLQIDSKVAAALSLHFWIKKMGFYIIGETTYLLGIVAGDIEAIELWNSIIYLRPKNGSEVCKP